MKKLLFLATTLLFACSTQQSGVNWMSGSFTAALDAARTQNKPILVDFYSDT